jgi:hypothetical protein
MSKPAKVIVNDSEWAKNLEYRFENYIENCQLSIDGEEPANFTTLSGEIFCGCSTCYTREQLFFLVPLVIEGYNQGKVSIEE